MISTQEEQELKYNQLLSYLEGYIDLLASKGPDSTDLVINEMRELVTKGDFATSGFNTDMEGNQCCSSDC